MPTADMFRVGFKYQGTRMMKEEEVIESLWGSHFFLGVMSLDVYISNLEQKFGTRLINVTGSSRYFLSARAVS